MSNIQGDKEHDNRYVFPKYIFLNREAIQKDCFAQIYAFIDIHFVGGKSWSVNGVLFVATSVLKQFVQNHCNHRGNVNIFSPRWHREKFCF